MRKSIWMGCGAIGAYTAAERSKGRYMRAPDGHGDADFAAFEAAGEVEVGKPAIESNEAPPADDKPKKAPSGKGPREPKAAPAAKPAADKAAGKDKPGEADGAGEGDDIGEEGEGEEDEEEEEEEKPKRKTSDRIKELTGKNRSQGRLIEQLSTRLAALEKGGLPANQNGGNSSAGRAPAPDPSDATKYPLGHLDDRYIEDKLEWLAEDKAAKQADAVLQRQQENEQNAVAERQHAALLEKVEDLSTRGTELYDDFQESVVDAGMKGVWDLGQPTFEAAHEAENGAQILYELSQDKKEANRVAKLSPYGQAKFVMERDAEIGLKAKPRTKPKAGEPPATQTRGANSSARINPATDNLDDFEKAWAADAKGK